MFRKKSRKLFDEGGGEIDICVRSVPRNILVPVNCFNHELTIENRILILSCETSLGKRREWVYMIEEEYLDGKAVVYLPEKTFNSIILKMRATDILSIKNQKSLALQGRIQLPIQGYDIERGY